MISPEKWHELQTRMKLLGITEEDLQEKFILGSGSGGQNLHKTRSCVFLKHLPSEITVKCQKERERQTNRYYARLRLCQKIESLEKKEKNERDAAIDKLRRQKKQRSRRAKKKMLDDKRHQSNLKKSRTKIERD